MQDIAPRVSVIVPVFNVERFLDQALDSIENQTFRDLEVVCVNDGSSDSSLTIMKKHAERDARIRIVDKPNGGYGSACNRGLQEAQGTWIAIVEPDDWILPTMFEDMLALADSFADAPDIVKTPYWRVIDADTPAQRMLNCSYKGRIRPPRQPFNITDKTADHLLIHHPSIWSALYRADFMRDCDIRFREIPGAGWADNPFLVETLCQAERIVYLDQAYYCYREETEEKSAAFARNCKTVPFERWHDMVDVLERLGVTDEAVLRAQYRRGFTYLDYIVDEIDAHDPEMQSTMSRMFARMDEDLVVSDPDISPAWKKRFLEFEGRGKRFVNPVPYAFSLMGSGLYSLKNIGPAETLKVVGAVARFNKSARELAAPHEQPHGDGDSTCKDASSNTSLSIVMPVYNAEPYLEESLESLAAQTHENFEVVCVDDGSTDSSSEILDRWARDDARFHILRKRNGGPSSARNVGIHAATGDYICFLDADDLLEPNACQRILEETSCGSRDCVVFGWSCFPADEANDWLIERTNVRNAFYPWFTPEVLFREMTNPFLRLAVRRELLEREAVLFDEHLRIGEDGAFLFALFPHAVGIRLIPDKLYRYRMPHEGSITSVSRDGDALKCADDLSMMVSIFENWDKTGLLADYSPQLIHWFVSFWLYTALRQPASVRNPLVQTAQQLLRAHFTLEDLRSLNVPAHDHALIDVVLSAHDEKLAMSERQLTQTMLQWRLAEYGVMHLVRTILERR